MKHFLMITNTHKDEGARLTDALAAYIREKGGTCRCFFSSGESLMEAAPDPEEISKETDCVLVLGGDGTLIRAAAKLVGSKIPLIGVNLGTLGYLCELEENSAFAAIDQLMAGNYMIEERMMLAGCSGKENREQISGIALNDIVFHRAGPMSVVSLIVYVNGEYLHTFRADGMILSTPTGSTGYNISAGGPIVDPKAQMILITPINAHNLSSRSIVVGAEDEIVIEIARRRAQGDEAVEVSFDGDHTTRLFVGERFVVQRAMATTRICKLSNQSFLELLSKKMQTYT